LIYILSKLVAAFLLPPGLFVTILFLLTYIYKRRSLIFVALFIWLLSLKPLGNLLLTPLESFSKKETLTPSYVVVLGGGQASEAKNLPTSASGTKRILYGAMIAYRKKLPLIITGCEGRYAKKTIEEIDSAFGLDLNYTIEAKSRDTYENALFTRRAIGPKPIILVTSAYHMPRSYYLFKHFGFTIDTAATDFKIDWDLKWQHYLPSSSGFERIYTALHEYLGLISLYLRGIL